MALLGINPARGREREESTMDKILKAVQIGQGVLGAALTIPKFIQDRQAQKETLNLKKQELGQEKDLMGARVDIARTQAESDKASTLADMLKTHRLANEGESGVEIYGQKFVPLPQTLKLNDIEQLQAKMIENDFSIAQPNDPNAIKFKLGGQEVSVIPKPSDPSKMEGREDSLRKEFIANSKQFIEQVSSMSRVEESAKDPSPAGDLALIFNYMKILDPGSSVREGEFANAQNATGVPDRVVNLYNQLMSGERLGEIQRKDFLERARKLYKGEENIHRMRENQYRNIANERDLNVQRTIPFFGLPGGKSKQPAPVEKPKNLRNEWLNN